MTFPSEQVEVALIGLAVVIVQGVFGFLSQHNHLETKAGISEIKTATNGLSARLAASQKKVGHDEGLAEGRAEK